MICLANEFCFLGVMAGYLDWAILAAFLFGYALLSGRLQRTPVSAAMVFLLGGWVLSPSLLGWLHLSLDSEGLRILTEFTLALILFTDAAKANLAMLRNSARLPIRLLGLGLPLTIVVGALLAHLLFPAWPLAEAGILAVALAPTDAALGQPVVTNPAVPAPLREDLSAESGLNDGICVPFLLFLLTLISGSLQPSQQVPLLGQFFLSQIGVGVLVGVFLAMVGCTLRDRCLERGWIAQDWRPLLAVALPVLAFTLAQLLGGSGFIACFCAGLAMAGLTRRPQEQDLVAAEGAGDVLSLITWMAFGAVVLPRALAAMTPTALVYALLSLTVVRILPVALALAPMGLRWSTTLFIGWFGPRGLATIVFAVMVLERDLPHGQQIAGVMALTVAISVMAHGFSAVPLVQRFSRATGAGGSAAQGVFRGL